MSPMRKALLALGVVIVSLLGWAASQTPSVQIGTFNLEFFTDFDRTTGTWCEEHNPRTPEVVGEMARFINSLDIEVLALQEVENAQALELLLSFNAAREIRVYRLLSNPAGNLPTGGRPLPKR